MVYNLEYELLDSIGRAKKTFHHGVYGSVDQLETAKQEVITQHKDQQVRFNVHIIENLFTTVSLS